MLFLRKKNPIIYFGEFYILAYLVLLCFTILHFAGTAFFLSFFFFQEIECLWPTMNEASLSAPVFPIEFAHFVSFCYTLRIPIILQTFSLLLHLLWQSGISDAIALIVLGCHKPC